MARLRSRRQDKDEPAPPTISHDALTRLLELRGLVIDTADEAAIQRLASELHKSAYGFICTSYLAYRFVVGYDLADFDGAIEKLLHEGTVVEDSRPPLDD